MSSLGNRGDDIDWLDLGEHDQDGVVGLHQVAEVDLPDPRDAIDRRADRSVFDIELGGVDRRLVEAYDRLVCRDSRELCRVLLLRRKLLLQQRGVAHEILARVFEVGLVPGLRRVGLIERRLKWPRIDLEQHVAGLDRLALVEIDCGDVSGYPAPYRDGVEGNDSSEAADDDRHVLRLRRLYRDRHSPRCGNVASLSAAGWRSGAA